MKQLRFYLVLTYLTFAFMTSAKKNTFITYEVGVNKDVIRLSNPQNNVGLYNPPIGVPGILVTQQITNLFYIESGLYFGESTGVDMITMSLSDTTNLLFYKDEFHIPIRLRLQKSLFNERINLFASTGVNLVFPSDNYDCYGLFSYTDKTTLTTNKFIYTKNQTLLELGTGIDIRLTKNFFMGIRYRYDIGFKKHIDLDATATNSESNEITNYHLTSNGNYHSFMLSASYRISRIWNKR